jgi:ubiquinone/menaquinone biosynthesis C-methylase UbiE/N-acetylglutamate synthase-like GNAT family acetyltransferase
MTVDSNIQEAARVRRAVRERYAGIATGGSCCGPAALDSARAAKRSPVSCCVPTEAAAPSPGPCCGPAPRDAGGGPERSPVACCAPTKAAAPAGAALATPGSEQPSGLGCGYPLAFAELAEGETVLDLGCGAGGEVLAAARRVGPAGRAIGVDMTEEMLEVARAALRGSGLRNVEFLKGEIESLPLGDASVDVVVSNCVLNLSPDKTAALREAFRVLRPGGRFVVADIVVEGSLEPDPAWRAELSRWTACQAGALTEEAYARGLREAGFANVRLERLAEYGGDSCCEEVGTEMENGAGTQNGAPPGARGTDTKPRREVPLVSDLISARKPAAPVPFDVPSARAMAGDRDSTKVLPQVDAGAPVPQPGIPPVRVLAADLPALTGLLAAAGLDPAGLDASNVRAFAVADAGGPAASVAYELEGGSALLRSLAVRPDLRGRGLGARLLDHALTQARREGAVEAFLLTETAAPFFGARGWNAVERAVVDARFPESEQVRSICPASATAMWRSLA